MVFLAQNDEYEYLQYEYKQKEKGATEDIPTGTDNQASN